MDFIECITHHILEAVRRITANDKGKYGQFSMFNPYFPFTDLKIFHCIFLI